MNYVILEAQSTGDLMRQVEAKLKEGYVCTGGVQAVAGQQNTYLWWFYQAMVWPKG